MRRIFSPFVGLVAAMLTAPAVPAAAIGSSDINPRPRQSATQKARRMVRAIPTGRGSIAHYSHRGTRESARRKRQAARDIERQAMRASEREAINGFGRSRRGYLVSLPGSAFA